MMTSPGPLKQRAWEFDLLLRAAINRTIRVGAAGLVAEATDQ
jgi:hypothetical protein